MSGHPRRLSARRRPLQTVGYFALATARRCGDAPAVRRAHYRLVSSAATVRWRLTRVQELRSAPAAARPARLARETTTWARLWATRLLVAAGLVAVVGTFDPAPALALVLLGPLLWLAGNRVQRGAAALRTSLGDDGAPLSELAVLGPRVLRDSRRR